MSKIKAQINYCSTLLVNFDATYYYCIDSLLDTFVQNESRYQNVEKRDSEQEYIPMLKLFTKIAESQFNKAGPLNFFNKTV